MKAGVPAMKRSQWGGVRHEPGVFNRDQDTLIFLIL